MQQICYCVTDSGFMSEEDERIIRYLHTFILLNLANQVEIK